MNGRRPCRFAIVALAAILTACESENEDTRWQQVQENPTLVSLVAFIEDYPDGTHAADVGARLEQLIPEEEERLVRDLQENGFGDRFTIDEFQPSLYVDIILRYTIRQEGNSESGPYLNATEFPGDAMMGSTFSPSVQRFDGNVSIQAYTFRSTGGKYNRLTFGLLDNGYVYLRGVGTVTLPSGESVEFH